MTQPLFSSPLSFFLSFSLLSFGVSQPPLAGKFVLAATGLGLLVEQRTVAPERLARAAASAGRFCTELTGYVTIRVTRPPK